MWFDMSNLHINTTTVPRQQQINLIDPVHMTHDIEKHKNHPPMLKLLGMKIKIDSPATICQGHFATQ